MTLINGGTILRASGLSESQEACVEILEQALDLAREGKIEAVAVVTCMKDGFASASAGRRAGDLHLGCADLQRKILDAVTAPKQGRQYAQMQTAVWKPSQ